MNDMKIDKINKLFNCSYCNNIYKEPILLPCGETVCKQDITKFNSTSSHIECYFCQQQHLKPSAFHEYPILKQLSNLIDNGDYKIDLGETFSYGRNLLSDLSIKLSEIENINSNSSNFFNLFFENLINEIEMRRDQMKLEIDVHFNQILTEICNHKVECELNLKEFEKTNNNVYLRKELDEYKSKLNGWHSLLDTLIVNEKQRDRVILETKLTKLKLEQKLNDLKNEMFLDKLVGFKFEPFDVTKYATLNYQKYLVEDSCVFKFTLNGFKEYFSSKTKSESISHVAGGFEWSIRIENEERDFMDLYLCNSRIDPKISEEAIFNAEFQLTMINTQDPSENYLLNDIVLFTVSPRSEWSWYSIYKIEDLVKNKFYNEQNDTITFEVVINVKLLDKS